MHGLVYCLFFRENQGSKIASNLPQSDVTFHLIANFRVDMRERDQFNRILH